MLNMIGIVTVVAFRIGVLQNECALHMANKGYQLFILDTDIHGHGHGYGVCVVLRGNAI